MTVQFTITFSSLLVEDQHLITLYQRRQYFAYYLCAFYGRNTYFYFTIVVNQQYFFKFHNSTAFCVLNVMNEQLLSFFSFELLSVNFYDYVHLSFYI